MKRLYTKKKVYLNVRAERVRNKALRRAEILSQRGRERGHRDRSVGKSFAEQYCDWINERPKFYSGLSQKITFPAVFSLIDNPVETLRALQRVAVSVCTVGRRGITIDQERCEQIDHAASSILNAILEDGFDKHGLSIGGTGPVLPKPAEIAFATGALQALVGRENLSASFDEFEFFPRESGSVGHIDPYNYPEFVKSSVSVVQYIDRCLKATNRQLSQVGLTRLFDIVSEVLENAEHHSTVGAWWVGGYMVQRDGADVGDCRICIYNLGTTMAQSLQRLSPEDPIRLAAANYATSHLGPRRRRRTTSLWTVYALQERVSSKQVSGDRGNGTVQLLTFFQELAGSFDDSRMCILSGNAHVLLDGSYAMKDGTTWDGNVGNVLAFNERNSLEYPPDHGVVRDLSVAFPGSVISMRFKLRPEHLSELVESNEDEN